jgi:hypothetical protein
MKRAYGTSAADETRNTFFDLDSPGVDSDDDLDLDTKYASTGTLDGDLSSQTLFGGSGWWSSTSCGTASLVAVTAALTILGAM